MIVKVLLNNELILNDIWIKNLFLILDIDNIIIIFFYYPNSGTVVMFFITNSNFMIHKKLWIIKLKLLIIN